MLRVKQTIGVLSLAAIICFSGCKSAGSRQNTFSSEPILTDPGRISAAPDSVELDPLPPPRVSAVERHPLLRKPVEYYEGIESGPVGKTASAVLIGVPAGVAGEIRQIVAGSPPR